MAGLSGDIPALLGVVRAAAEHMITSEDPDGQLQLLPGAPECQLQGALAANVAALLPPTAGVARELVVPQWFQPLRVQAPVYLGTRRIDLAVTTATATLIVEVKVGAHADKPAHCLQARTYVNLYRRLHPQQKDVAGIVVAFDALNPAVATHVVDPYGCLTEKS